MVRAVGGPVDKIETERDPHHRGTELVIDMTNAISQYGRTGGFVGRTVKVVISGD